MPLSPPDVDAINAEASILMKQGIRLLSDPHPGAVAEALNLFDQALELRRSLPFENNAELRYGLATCWLNRADALARLGDAATLDAYDEGIGLLHGLDLGEDPRFPRRLALAHQNRGLALRSPEESAKAFTAAIAVLEQDHAASIADRQHLMAVIWMNLANTHVSEGTVESGTLARAAALRSMELVAETEAADAEAAEVGLKARHVLCRMLAMRMSLAAESSDVHEATDVVDDGLALVRSWEQRGVSRFRGIAYDLFRFGSVLYGRYQPQFLKEFIVDNIDPAKSSTEFVESEEMCAAADEALERLDGVES